MGERKKVTLPGHVLDLDLNEVKDIPSVNVNGSKNELTIEFELKSLEELKKESEKEEEKDVKENKK